jgi:hypothetical protein
MKNELLWLAEWCKKENLELVLEGECGFGRECVGVASKNDGTYPDYEWYGESYERIDNNGNVWAPGNAYHKHPCTAVLGRGEKAIKELYEWCLWFENNGFHYKIISAECTNEIELMLGRDKHHVMERSQS